MDNGGQALPAASGPRWCARLRKNLDAHFAPAPAAAAALLHEPAPWARLPRREPRCRLNAAASARRTVAPPHREDAPRSSRFAPHAPAATGRARAPPNKSRIVARARPAPPPPRNREKHQHLRAEMAAKSVALAVLACVMFAGVARAADTACVFDGTRCGVSSAYVLSLPAPPATEDTDQ